jgi:hypothetical protein
MVERDDDGAIRDLRSLVVSAAGGLVETGDRWEPYYLSDPAGGRVGPVSEFLRDLQAAGRPATTQPSYSLALLRWFRRRTPHPPALSQPRRRHPRRPTRHGDRSRWREHRPATQRHPARRRYASMNS